MLRKDTDRNPKRGGKVRAWLAACRPKTLAAACAPVAVGTAAGASTWELVMRSSRDACEHGTNFGDVAWDRAACALVFALLVQILCNLANDLGDFLRGADTPRRLGPARMAATGALSPRELRMGIALCAVAALAVGLPLAIACGWELLPVGLVCILAAFAYTNGPFPLAYKGLGDVFVLLFFGFVAVLFSAYVQCGGFPLTAWLGGLSCGLLAVNILLVNNARDMETDAIAGKRTTVVRFGRGFARYLYVANVLVAFLLPIVFGAPALAPLTLLVLFLPALCFAREFWRVPDADPRRYNPLLGKTALILLLHSALFALALFIRFGA